MKTIGINETENYLRTAPQNIREPKCTIKSVAMACLGLILAGLLTAQVGHAQTGSGSYTLSPANRAATKKHPLVWNIPAAGGSVRVKIFPINPIPAQNWNNPAQIRQFSAAKAKAAKASIDQAKIKGVTVTVKEVTFPLWLGRTQVLPNGWVVPALDMVTMSQVTVDGITKTVTRSGDQTLQGGNGVNFTPGGGGGGGGYTPTMRGPSLGSASGLDPLGNQSVLGFGFYDASSGSPVLYIAAIFPTAGETDDEILSDVSEAYNLQFGSAGYTAQYDLSNSTLWLNQSIPWTQTFWFGSTDTGLDYDFEMITPEL